MAASSSLDSRASSLPADAFVEFGSAELTKDDVLSLCSGCWLTDEAVAFATEKVQRLFLPAVRKQCSLYHPSAVQSLKLSANSTPGAGTHWSLLVADLAAKHTMHLDSGGGDGNSQPAAEFAQKLAAAAGGTWSHSEPACPKQDNSSDCGVFCALFCRSTMQALSAADGGPLTEHIVSQSCKGLVDGASSSLRASCLESACSAAEHGK